MVDESTLRWMLSRIFVPVTTPFCKNGEIDFGALEFNLDFLSSSGIQGFSALGSNAESGSLTKDERLQVLRFIAQRKREGQVLIACAAYETQQEVEEFFEHATSLGADFGRLQAPSRFQSDPREEAMYVFYKAVADASHIPLLVYNAPKRNGITMSPEFIKRISLHGNVVGLKDSSNSGTQAYMGAHSHKFLLLAGSITSLFPAMVNGAVGGTVSLANALPGLAIRLFECGAACDYKRGIPLHEKANRISAAISGRYGIPGLKTAMTLAGLRGGFPRPPLRPIEEEHRLFLMRLLNKEEVFAPQI